MPQPTRLVGAALGPQGPDVFLNEGAQHGSGGNDDAAGALDNVEEEDGYLSPEVAGLEDEQRSRARNAANTKGVQAQYGILPLGPLGSDTYNRPPLNSKRVEIFFALGRRSGANMITASTTMAMSTAAFPKPNKMKKARRGPHLVPSGKGSLNTALTGTQPSIPPPTLRAV